MTRLDTLPVLFALLLCIGCGGSGPQGTNSKVEREPVVYAMSYPLFYFAERIAGDKVPVKFPAPEDIDPAYWKPNTETITQMQSASLILFNGANYSSWQSRVTLPDGVTINTTEAVKDQYIEIEDAIVHKHGPEGEHSHSGTAFTTWLDFQIAIAQANAVRDALATRFPEHKETFTANAAELEKQLKDLDQTLLDLIPDEEPPKMIASHPVYQYLARRYGIAMESVHWEPDETPDEEQWTEFSQLLSKHPAKLMLWEGTPTEQTAAKLGELGVKVVVFEPAGNRPEAGDFLSVMQENIERLQAALAE